MNWESETRYWIQFIHNYHSSHLVNTKDCFQQIFNVLQNIDNDYIRIKIHLLSFLKDNSYDIIKSSNHVNLLFNLLFTQLIELPCSSRIQIHLIEQIIICISTLLIILDDILHFNDKSRIYYINIFINICMDILRGSILSFKNIESNNDNYNNNISSSSYSFRDSVERGLVEVAGKTGIHIGGISSKSLERSLRLYTAECLKELEEHYPGLLSNLYDEILSLSQYEITHASQSYILLTTLILKNRKKSSLSNNRKNNIQNNNKKQELQPSISISNSMTNIPSISLDYMNSMRFNYPYSSNDIPEKYKVYNNSLPSISQSWDYLDLINDCNNTYSSLSEEEQIIRTEIIYLRQQIEYCSKWGCIELIRNLIIILKQHNIPLQSFFDEYFYIFKNSIYLPFIHILLILCIRFPSSFNHNLKQLQLQILSLLKSSSLINQQLILLWYNEIYSLLFQNQSTIIIPNELLPNTFDNLQVRTKKIYLYYQIKAYNNDKTTTLSMLNHLYHFHYYPKNYYLFNNLTDIIRFILSSFNHLIDIIGEYLCKLVVKQSQFCYLILQLVDSSLYPLPDNIQEQLIIIIYNLLLYQIDIIKLPQYFSLITYLLSNKNTDPLPLLHLIYKMLENISLSDNMWILGNKILDIIRNTLLLHQSSTIHSIIINILEYMKNNYSLLDIRERCGFYLRLFTCLPINMICTILSNNSFEYPLNNTDNINILKDDEDIKNLSPFTIQCKIINKNKSIQYPSEFIDTISIEDYYKIIKTKSISQYMDIEITLCLENQNNIESIELYSIITNIIPSNNQSNIYKPFPLIHIPYLSSKNNKIVSKVYYTPIQPIPIQLDVNITCHNQYNKYYEQSINPILIEFIDLIFPISFSHNNINYFKQDLYNYLWNNELKLQYLENIKIIHKQIHEIYDIINNNTLLLQLEVKLSTSNKNQYYFIGLLLPHYHILLDISVYDSYCKIIIKTDYWISLGYIEKYLNSIFQ